MEERDWFITDPRNLAISLSLEASELLEHFQWKNHSVEEIKSNLELNEKIRKEIADVLIYSIHLMELLGLDGDTIIQEKLAHAAKKYPVDLIKGPAGSPAHQKIKKEWREKGIN
jgi:NTP pyrophosphatase (non-canonical NTP hydrolase)